MVLICISHIDHFCMCLLDIHLIFFCEISAPSFPHLKKMDCMSYYWVAEVLYISYIQIPYCINNLWRYMCCLFYFLDGAIRNNTSFLILMSPIHLFFLLSIVLLMSHLRFCVTQGCKYLFLCLLPWWLRR